MLSVARLNELLTGIRVQVTVLREGIRIQFSRQLVRKQVLETDATETQAESDLITLKIAASLKRCCGEMQLIIPGAVQHHRQQPVPSLVKALSRAYDWIERIEKGEFKDQRAIAAAFGFNERYVSRILPMAFLAPNVIESILDGKQQPGLSLDALLKEVPLLWNEQRTSG